MIMSSTTRMRVIWGLRVLLALFFAATGGAKLVSTPHMIQAFEEIGFGQWLRYATGAVEVGGGVLLLIPRTGFYAGLILCVEMVCAVAVHLFLKVSGTALPAVVLVISCGFIAYYLRPPGVLANGRSA